MSEINLLSHQDASYLQKQKIVKTLRTISVASLLLVLLLGVIAFCLKLFSPLPSLLAKEKSLIGQISQKSDIVAQINVVSQKTKTIETIEAKRTNYASRLDLFNSPNFSGINLDSILMDKSETIFHLSSSDLLSLNNLFENLTTLSKEKKFKKVTLKGIAIDSNGYSTAMDIAY